MFATWRKTSRIITMAIASTLILVESQRFSSLPSDQPRNNAFSRADAMAI
jgi:hypothetical protein